MAKWAALMLIFLCAVALGCSRETGEISRQKAGTVKKGADSKNYSVSIKPESPTVSDSIFAELATEDGERVSGKLEFIWERNMQKIEGINSQRIEGSNFKKGDVIRAIIMPQVGELRGRTFYSEDVVVKNAPPVVALAKIKPDKEASKKMSLSAAAEGKDQDDDSLFFKYQWIRNGAEEIEGANTNTLPPVHFKHGDFINVRVTANDGIADSEPATSGPVAIINTPPEIVSQPPTDVKGFNYIYKVSAVDLDKDNLNYSLSNAPAGMSIDSKSGEIRWNIAVRDKGSHDIEIAVDDGNGGKAVQGYVLTIKLPEGD